MQISKLLRLLFGHRQQISKRNMDAGC